VHQCLFANLFKSQLENGCKFKINILCYWFEENYYRNLFIFNVLCLFKLEKARFNKFFVARCDRSAPPDVIPANSTALIALVGNASIMASAAARVIYQPDALDNVCCDLLLLWLL
jgi:hypothetical protein